MVGMIVSACVPRELFDKIEQRAKEENTNKNKLFNRIIKNYFECEAQ